MKLWHKLIPSKGSGIFCWLHKPSPVRIKIHKAMRQVLTLNLVTQTGKAKSAQNPQKHGVVTRPSPCVTGVSSQGRCAGLTPENPALDLGLQRHKNKPKTNADGSGLSLAYPAGWTYSSEPLSPTGMLGYGGNSFNRKEICHPTLYWLFLVHIHNLSECVLFCLTLKVF